MFGRSAFQSKWIHRGIFWLLMLAASVIFATFPTYPHLFTEALSEKAVLSYAHAQGWQYGKDIVFTYGPLGFLSSRYFFEHAWRLRFVVDVLFSLAVCGGVIRLAWQMRPGWRWLLIGTFLFLGTNIDPRYDLLLYIGVFSWAVLCFVESGRKLLLDCALVAGLAAFGVLVKANFLFLAILSLGAIALDLCARRNWRVVSMLVGGFAMFFCAGWLAAGQRWNNLGAFFSHILPVATGYNQAVALDGMQILRERGFWAIALIALAALSRSVGAFGSKKGLTDEGPETKLPDQTTNVDGQKPLKRFSLWPFWRGTQLKLGVNESETSLLGTGWRRLIVAGWLGGVLFLIWKHGFVRGDMFHMGFFFGFVPFCAVALEAFPAKTLPSRISRVFALACWGLVLFTMQWWSFAPLPTSLLQPFRTLSVNASILVHPIALKQERLEARKRDLPNLDLPKVRQIATTNSVDVFGQDPLYAIENGLNYHPRPVFQSYMGYNAHVSRLNEQLYLSSDAPQFVLFRLTPIDRKFPPLEDSLALRTLLFNYELTAEDPPYLLLRQRTITPPKLELLQETTVRAAERINLRPFGQTNLWMELDIASTASDRLRTFFYKPGIVRIGVWSGSTNALYKAPAPMLQAGFMASPVLLNDNDVREFYRGGRVNRPDGYSVQFGSKQQTRACRCRIYAIAPRSQ